MIVYGTPLAEGIAQPSNAYEQSIRIYLCFDSTLARERARSSGNSSLYRFHLERRPVDLGICTEFDQHTGARVKELGWKTGKPSGDHTNLITTKISALRQQRTLAM
jgi:hypothetical protein